MARWVKLVRVCCDGASCIPLLAALASPFALRRGGNRRGLLFTGFPRARNDGVSVRE